MRVPPQAGPSRVECTAMMMVAPVGWSRRTIISSPSQAPMSVSSVFSVVCVSMVIFLDFPVHSANACVASRAGAVANTTTPYHAKSHIQPTSPEHYWDTLDEYTISYYTYSYG